MGLVVGFVSVIAGIVIEISVTMILVIVSEDFAAMSGDFVSSMVSLFVAVPLTKLATADIYRRLEGRVPAAAAGGAVGGVVMV